MNTKLILFFSIVLLLSACQTDTNSDANQAENAVPTATEKKEDPAKVFLDYVAANPDDHENNGSKLYEAAMTYYKKNGYPVAVKYLNQAIRNHYSSSQTPVNTIFMAEIYKNKYKKPEISEVIYQAAADAFPNDAKIQEGLQRNPVNIPDFGAYLDGLSKKLTNEETGRIEAAVANDFVAATESHAMVLPNDPQNPEYLHKAGEIARSMRAFPKAIDLYNWIYTKYPDSKKAAQSLFMTAFTYDNELKNVNEAKKLYQQFLTKYPNDDFADDTKFLLENLGKTNEDIIKGFGEN